MDVGEAVWSVPANLQAHLPQPFIFQPIASLFGCFRRYFRLSHCKVFFLCRKRAFSAVFDHISFQSRFTQFLLKLPVSTSSTGFSTLIAQLPCFAPYLYSIIALQITLFSSNFCVVLSAHLSPPLSRFCPLFLCFRGCYQDRFSICCRSCAKDRCGKTPHRSPVLAKSVFTLWAVPSAPAPAGRGRKWPCVRSGCRPGAG